MGRKRQSGSNNSPKQEGKSRKKRRCTFEIGQSSGSQQPEPKEKDPIKTKSVPDGTKILKDRVDRRIKNDKMADMLSFIWCMICAMANSILFPYPLLVDFHNQIKRQWPVRSDVQSIRGKIGAIKDADRMEETEKMRELIKIEEEFEKLKEQRLGVSQNKRQCSERFDLKEKIKEILDAAPMEVPDKMQRFVDIGEEIRRLDEQGLEVYQIKRQCSERFDLENVEEDMEEMQDTTEARREETEKKEKGFEDVRKENHRLKEELRRQSEELCRQSEELCRQSEESDKILKDLTKVGQRLTEKRRKDFQVCTEVNELIKIYIHEVGDVETSSAKLSSAFPLLPLGEIATNGHTADQDHGSVQTREQLHYSDKDLDDLKNKVFTKDNNKVDVLDFPGLKEAIKNARGNVPDNLQPIASKIDNDRGTPTEFAHFGIQVLVCAAIKEMEDWPLQELKPCTLLKWGATLNRAKELGFLVKFADTLLEKKVDSSFVCSKVG